MHATAATPFAPWPSSRRVIAPPRIPKGTRARSVSWYSAICKASRPAHRTGDGHTHIYIGRYRSNNSVAVQHPQQKTTISKQQQRQQISQISTMPNNTILRQHAPYSGSSHGVSQLSAPAVLFLVSLTVVSSQGADGGPGEPNCPCIDNPAGLGDSEATLTIHLGSAQVRKMPCRSRLQKLGQL